MTRPARDRGLAAARLLLPILLICSPLRGAAEELLIVAPDALRPALADYAAARQRALSCRVAILEEILAAAEGADDPERLKRWLFARWREGGLRYVLLVGDADVMPLRYMVLDRVTAPAFDYAFYPSDLYYADLARADGGFDDWNAARDAFHAGYYGEVRGEKNKTDAINYDAIDYRPEVAVGRWPVSTPEEVAVVAAKSLAYDEAVRGGRHRGAGVAAFVACGGWIENRPPMDRMIECLGPEWTVRRLYFADAARDEGTPPPDEAQVVRLLNEGAALVVHSGHGGDGEWHGALSLASLEQLDNAAAPSILISAGCSTARLATLPPYEAYVDVAGGAHAGTNAGEVFDAPPPPPAPYQRGAHNPTGLGEALLRRGPSGAVVYIGCNTGSQPCGMTLVDGFVRGCAAPGPARLGDAWSAALRHYVEAERLDELVPTESWYPASIFFQGMKFMFLGDPSLPVARAAAPRPRRD
jgi:hypothetical protein